MLKLKPEVVRKYELIFIFDSKQNNFESSLENTKNLFSNSGIEILKESDMGKKQLAYEVKKNTTGHYVAFELMVLPSKVIEIKNELNLDTNILKFMFVNLDK